MAIKIHHDITNTNGTFYVEGNVLITRDSADIPVIRKVIDDSGLPYAVNEDNITTSGKRSVESKVPAAAVIVKGRIGSPIPFDDITEANSLSKIINIAIGQRKAK